MVTEFGMSDLGPTIYTQAPQFGVWPGDSGPAISPEMQAKIDKEVSKIIDTGYKKAKEMLVKNRKKLDIVAAALLEKETLERDEFEKLVGKPISSSVKEAKKNSRTA